jgi:hypothetical protein
VGADIRNKRLRLNSVDAGLLVSEIAGHSLNHRLDARALYMKSDLLASRFCHLFPTGGVQYIQKAHQPLAGLVRRGKIVLKISGFCGAV